MWFQHILMYNSWPSRCPSFDQPLLPRWKVWTWRFWKSFGRDDWGLVTRWEFFCMLWLVVMVVWWGRRNWWDGSAQSQATGLMMDIAKGGSNLEYNFHECIIKKNTRCINMNSQNPRTQGSTFYLLCFTLSSEPLTSYEYPTRSCISYISFENSVFPLSILLLLF
jgi:hypothetical protein